MSKVITSKELAQIVTEILTAPEDPQLPLSKLDEQFVLEIGRAVARYCGGEIRGVEYAERDDATQGRDLTLVVRGDDHLPEDGGIWARFDPEGDIWAPYMPPGKEPTTKLQVMELPYGFVEDRDLDDPRLRFRSDKLGVHLYVGGTEETRHLDADLPRFGLVSIGATETAGWSSATDDWADIQSDLRGLAQDVAKPTGRRGRGPEM